jgi:hypothetical protein
MDFLSDSFESKAPWTLGMNSDYDDLIWNIIFEEDGIIPEDDEVSNEDLLDELYEDLEL